MTPANDEHERTVLPCCLDALALTVSVAAVTLLAIARRHRHRTDATR